MTDLTASVHPAIAHMVAHAEPMLREYGYPGVFASNFLEGVGVPLPGQSLLIVGSVLAEQGEFRLDRLLVTAFVAVVGGSSLGYWLGRLGGRGLLTRVRFPQRKLERVEQFFTRRGVLVVFVARFVDGFRQTVPIIAGGMGMPWWPFFTATVLGAATWVGCWSGAAFLLTKHAAGLLAGLHQITRHGWYAGAVVLVVAPAWLLPRKREP